MTRIAFHARISRHTARPAPPALRIVSCIALLAILSQIALPHLHRWISGGHDGDRVGSTALATTIGDAHESTGACGEDADLGCATCQALAQIRSFVAPQVEWPRPAIVSIGTCDRRAASCAPERPVAHAPRSPPATA